jgi:hypothetical protein
VAGDVAFGAFPRILAAKRKHVTAMATPVRPDIGERFKSMGNAVVDFLFVALLLVMSMKDGNKDSETLTPVLDFEIHLVTTFS